MTSKRPLAALFVLGATLVACSAAPDSSEPQGQASSAFSRAPGPTPVPQTMQVQNLCPPPMVPRAILAATPDWTCPDIPAGRGTLVGTDGRTWYSEVMASHPTSADFARMAPTFTSSMFWGSQPYCVYDDSNPTDWAGGRSPNERYGSRVFQVATDAGFLCGAPSITSPGTGGCPSCKPQPPP